MINLNGIQISQSLKVLNFNIVYVFLNTMVLSASLVVKLNDFVYFRNRKLTIYITYPNHKLIAQRTSRKISPYLSLFYYIKL